MAPKKHGDDYAVTYNMGDKKMSMVALEDIGNAAAKIFTQPSYIGQDVYVCGDQLTIAEVAEEFSKQLDIKCVYNKLDNDTFRGLGFPGAAEFGNMFQFYHDSEDFNQKRNLADSKKLVPQ